MSKIYYPIEEALERIAEETDFILEKPASEMNENELFIAQKGATKFITWVEDENYIQSVPMKPNGEKIYPI